MNYLNYSNLRSSILIALLTPFFFSLSAQDNCLDPDQFETTCGLVFDLCADYRQLPEDKTIDIYVTANDDLGTFDPCNIKLPDDANLLSHFGLVENINENGNCFIRYTLTDPDYELLDSFFYIFDYVDECSVPEGYCEDGKIWTIESKYYGPDDAAVIVSAKQGGNGTTAFDTVYNLMRGDYFFIDGSTKLAVNQTEWTYSFYENGNLSGNPFNVAKVHTSCSEDIFGVDFGIFKPIGGCVSPFKQRGTCVDRNNVEGQNFDNSTYRNMENEVDAEIVIDTTVVIIELFEPGLLPIEFGSITGRATQEGNLIEWTINSIVDEEFLILQKTINGRDFTNVSKYTNLKTGDFSFLDTDITAEYSTYRFKMVSFNGYDTYSRAISVRNVNSNNGVNIFPNPIVDVINIYAGVKIDKIRILNSHGQVVKAISSINSKHFNMVDIDLNAGIYFVEIQLGNSKVVVQKMTKL